jgi:hypothetical protein
MAEFKDLTGKIINAFVILMRVENNHKKARWLCRCKCGEEVIMYSSDFSESRNVKCCKKCFMKTFITHGKTKQRIYHIWQDMKERCGNPNNAGYHNYGGRGIVVCKRWADSFENFYADMGEPPTSKHTLERKNVNKGYGPVNCTWATKKEQGRNKRTNILFEINGVKKCLAEWCEIYNTKYPLVFKRVQAGVDIVEALTTPANGFWRKLEYDGKCLTVTEWSKVVGVPRHVINTRVRIGWDVKDILTRPRRFIKDKQ